MNLTEYKIEEYVKNPYICPNCGSDEIIVADDFCLESMSVLVNCHSCKLKWYEIYQLTSIEKYE